MPDSRHLQLIEPFKKTQGRKERKRKKSDKRKKERYKERKKKGYRDAGRDDGAILVNDAVNVLGHVDEDFWQQRKKANK